MKLKRSTIRDIAKASGYSVMTVSFALRADPRVKESTRLKIEKVAERLGYTPDPEIVRLMHRVRSNPSLETAEKIVILNSYAEQKVFSQDTFTQELMAAMVTRLHKHGFELKTCWMGEWDFDGHKIARALLDEKVSGIFIPPMAQGFPDDFQFPWEHFTTISVEERPNMPSVHRVHPNHFNNMTRLLEHLLALGFQRVGFASTAPMLGRDRFSYFGAFHTFFRELHSDLDFIPPLQEAQKSEDLKAWYERYQPEVIIVSVGWLEGVIRAVLGLSVPEDVSLVTLSAEYEALAGIVQKVDMIGVAAADLLMAHILRHDRGIPAFPKTVMIDGNWKDGRGYRSPRGG